MRIYVAQERAIKKRDGSHRNARDTLKTMNRSGYEGIVAAIKILANNNVKPFNSNNSGEELADCAYLDLFGADTAE